MNGQQISTVPHSTFISPRLILRNANSDKATENSSSCSDGACTGQGRDNRACRYERSETGNAQSPDTDKPTQRSAQHHSGARSRDGTLWSLACLPMSEVFRPDIFCHEERNVRITKP